MEQAEKVESSVYSIIQDIKHNTNIIDYFPYTPYPTQIEACKQIQEAIKAGKTDIVLEAPTGSGKSPIAIAIMKWMEHELDEIGALDTYQAGYVFTAEKILQDQYSREFDFLAVAKGRSNYDCIEMEDMNCNQGRCKSTKKACFECPYKLAIKVAGDSQLTTLNYHVFLFVSKHDSSPFLPRPILIFDEAHRIEEVLMGFVDLELTQKKLNELGISETIPDFDLLVEYRPWLIELHESILAKIAAINIYWKKNFDGVRDDKGRKSIYKKEMKKKDDLERLLFKIGILQKAIMYNPDDWVCEYNRFDKKLVAKPIYIHRYHQYRLMPFGGVRIYMSATISDYETFCNNIGIDLEHTAFVEMPHTFPIEHRMIYYTPVGKMSMRFKAETFPKMMGYLKNIAIGHGDWKGIFHTFTWEIAEYIMNHSPEIKDRLITHTTGNREETLNEFKLSDEPLILVSPSMYTGVDLKDDLSRFAVICKVPFGHLADIQIKTRKDIDPTWYDNAAVTKMLQAYGRSIRGKNDWAITYILDESFGWFYERVKFPQYFHDALRQI